eukprot:2293176-Rhodomonas_salina.1
MLWLISPTLASLLCSARTHPLPTSHRRPHPQPQLLGSFEALREAAKDSQRERARKRGGKGREGETGVVLQASSPQPRRSLSPRRSLQSPARARRARQQTEDARRVLCAAELNSHPSTTSAEFAPRTAFLLLISGACVAKSTARNRFPSTNCADTMGACIRCRERAGTCRPVWESEMSLKCESDLRSCRPGRARQR